MEKSFFKPWIGENYSTSGIAGKKILILGESHICGLGCGDCGNIDSHPECRDFTNNAIKYFLDYWTGKGESNTWMRTYTKFGNVFFNKYLSVDETVMFWNSIIFYNYVQFSTDKARVSPLKEEFEKSSKSFFEILKTYEPDLVIVWGKRLWQNLPSNGEFGDEVVVDNIKRGAFYYYTIDQNKTPIYMVHHPSSSSFNYSWHPFINKAIEML